MKALAPCLPAWAAHGALRTEPLIHRLDPQHRFAWFEVRHVGTFGASFDMPFVANHVRLRVQVEGLRQP